MAGAESTVSRLDKPFSQACENNKQPILKVLERAFKHSHQVLEIGSGTGQHAVYLAEHLSHLRWQTSDMPHNHNGILAWLADSQTTNLLAPIELTIGLNEWPKGEFDAVFTANTTHIMQPEEAQLMMELVAKHLPTGGVFCQYGPFKINGQYTSESNQAFNQHLLEQGCGGIRDLAELQAWGKGLELVEKAPMPANNFTLIWKK